MNDENKLRSEYKAKGYHDLGSINVNSKAAQAYHQSKNKEWYKIGNNLDFIVFHDLKSFATVDSGD